MTRPAASLIRATESGGAKFPVVATESAVGRVF